MKTLAVQNVLDTDVNAAVAVVVVVVAIVDDVVMEHRIVFEQ